MARLCGQALQGGVDLVAGVVRHHAARQGVGVHADAVVVAVLGLDDVAEAERRRAAAGEQSRLAGLPADHDAEHAVAKVVGVYDLFERHREIDGRAEPVGARFRGDFGPDRHRLDAVHLVRLLGFQGGQETGRVAVRVHDVAANQRIDADAQTVGILVPAADLVAEGQHLPTLPEELRAPKGRHDVIPAAERQDEVRRPFYDDILGKGDGEFDQIAPAVGLVGTGVGHDGYGGGCRGTGVHLVRGLGAERQARLRGRCGIAGEIRRAADQGRCRDGHAVGIVVVLLDAVAEPQLPRLLSGHQVGEARHLPLPHGDLEPQLAVGHHGFGERHLDLDLVAERVGVAGLRAGHDLRLLHHRRDAVDAVRGLVRQRPEFPDGRVAAHVLDGAADEGFGDPSDGDSRAVEVVHHNGIGEARPRFAVAGFNEIGLHLARTDLEPKLQFFRVGDVDVLIEPHGDLDHVADGVGAAARRRRGHCDAGHPGRIGILTAVDPMVRLLADGRYGGIECVAGAIGDRPGQGVGREADAVGVAVAHLDAVAVAYPAGVLAGNEFGRALDGIGVGSDEQRERRPDEAPHRLAEGHFQFDPVAGLVRPVAAGRGDDGGALDQRHHAIDPLPGPQRVRIAFRPVPEFVGDGHPAAGDYEAVGVDVALHHDIGEGRGVAFEARPRCRAPVAVEVELDGRGCGTDGLVEADSHHHFLADRIGAGRGWIGGNLHGHRTRRNPVHAMVRVPRQRRHPAVHPAAVLVVPDLAATHGVSVVADAVRVEIAGLHGVLEGERFGAAAVHVGHVPRLPPDHEPEHRLPRNRDRVVKGHLHRDYVGRVDRRVGRPGPGGGSDFRLGRRSRRRRQSHSGDESGSDRPGRKQSNRVVSRAHRRVLLHAWELMDATRPRRASRYTSASIVFGVSVRTLAYGRWFRPDPMGSKGAYAGTAPIRNCSGSGTRDWHRVVWPVWPRGRDQRLGIAAWRPTPTPPQARSERAGTGRRSAPFATPSGR